MSARETSQVWEAASYCEAKHATHSSPVLPFVQFSEPCGSGSQPMAALAQRWREPRMAWMARASCGGGRPPHLAVPAQAAIARVEGLGGQAAARRLGSPQREPLRGGARVQGGVVEDLAGRADGAVSSASQHLISLSPTAVIAKGGAHLEGQAERHMTGTIHACSMQCVHALLRHAIYLEG